ncbi:MAG: hypothetical protein ACREO5_04870 [Candidatus Binatia bacterium]
MKTRKPLLLLSIVLVAAASLYAQPEAARPPQIAPSYEVMLQVLVGSNDTANGGTLSPNLRAVSSQFKSNFAFSNYRLDNTFVGRVATNGSYEYKSISNTIGTGVDSETPTFLEWTLGTLRSAANDKGQTTFQAEPFRFGARVPVRVSSYSNDNSGKAIATINYESIGLVVNRVGLLENTPTLIGTISLPKTAGTLFLVLTVKPAL